MDEVRLRLMALEDQIDDGFWSLTWEEYVNVILVEIEAAGYSLVKTDRQERIEMAAAIYVDWSLGEPYALEEDDIVYLHRNDKS